MNVAQINIKINQNQTENKSSLQNVNTITSFSEILAKLNKLVQSETDVMTAASSLEKEADHPSQDQTESTILSTEEILQLDTILTDLITSIQQEQQLDVSIIEDMQLQINQSPINRSLLQGIQSSESDSLFLDVQPSGSSSPIQAVEPIVNQSMFAEAIQPLGNTSIGAGDQTPEHLLLHQNVLKSESELGLQGGQLPESSSPFETVQSSDRLSQIESILTKLGQLAEVNKDYSMDVGQWPQTSVEILETSDQDMIVLMQKLVQTIAQSDIEGLDKLEITSPRILDILDSSALLHDLTSKNQSTLEKGLPQQKVQDVNLETETWLGLDKSNINYSSSESSNQSVLASEGSGLDPQIPASASAGLMAAQQLEAIDRSNGSKVILPSTNLPITEFVPEVSEWIGRYMRITNGVAGSTEAKFSLYPDHLGPIEIKISSNEGQISAQILTNSSVAQEALEGQLQLLKQALQQHGLVVHKLDIIQQTPPNIELNQPDQSFSQNDSRSSHEQERREFTTSHNLSTEQDDVEHSELKKELVSITYGEPSRKTASQIDFTA